MLIASADRLFPDTLLNLLFQSTLLKQNPFQNKQTASYSLVIQFKLKLNDLVFLLLKHSDTL